LESPEFYDAVNEQIERSRDMLLSKNDHYNPGADKLRGFKATAAMRNTTPQGALAGMMVKHTLSVYDMCESGREYPIEVWNEKITDHINYLLLLRAVVEEQQGVKEDGHLVPPEEALEALRQKLYNPVERVAEAAFENHVDQEIYVSR
jgi:hypothetical protein